MKNTFQKESKTNTFPYKQKLSKFIVRIGLQKRVKENLPTKAVSYIPDRNLVLHKGRQNPRNNKNEGQFKRILKILHFFKRYWSKTKIAKMYCDFIICAE